MAKNIFAKKANQRAFGIIAGLILLSGVVSNALPIYASAEDGGKNKTSSPFPNSTNDTNVGDQISNFVHQAILAFKQQRNETLTALKDCREQANNVTDSSGTNKGQTIHDCFKAKVAPLREKYKDMREKFHELFKQFRENLIPFVKEAKGEHIGKGDKQSAIAHINEKRHNMISQGKQDILKGIENIKKR